MGIAIAGLAAGHDTLFFRDTSAVHLPAKWQQAEAWRAGTFPFLDATRAGGQPLIGNLNLVPLYPDNLLFLVAPILWAFNAHFWLHWLLMPWAMARLGRRVGLSRQASWAAGVVYACSGTVLSLFGFYNLVAGALLVPAFVASALGAVRGERWAVAGAAVLWALLILAGDPLMGVLALVVFLIVFLSVEWRGGSTRRGAGISETGSGHTPYWQQAVRLAAILVGGSLIALPQIVEVLRQLPTSYRGTVGYPGTSALVGSFDPRQLLDAIYPLFFGPPDARFWSLRAFGGQQPLFFSLAPGLATLAALPWAWRRHLPHVAQRVGWVLVGVGIFLALGRFNPVVSALVHLPGAAVLRFPVKAWLLVALGLALTTGVVFDRLTVSRFGSSTAGAAVGTRQPRELPEFLEERGGAWRKLTWSFLGLFVVYALFAWLMRSSPLAAGVSRLFELQLSLDLVDSNRARWLSQSLLLALASGLSAWVLWRRYRAAPAFLLGLHAATQLILLRPLMSGDQATRYVEPPALAETLSRDSPRIGPPLPPSLVQGSMYGLFGPSQLGAGLPAGAHWSARRAFAQLYPVGGMSRGFRYELNTSPEGLDSFFAHITRQALPRLNDANRLRVLQALGVSYLVLDRRLKSAVGDAAAGDPEIGRLAEVVAREDVLGVATWLYRLKTPAPPVLVSSDVRGSGADLRAGLEAMLAVDFDPRRQIARFGALRFAGGEPFDEVTGAAPADSGSVGKAEILEWSADRIRFRVDVSARAFALVQRSYLPQLQAFVDGSREALLVGNLSRILVPVPAGAHEVEIRYNKAPFWWSLFGPLAAGLLLVAARRRLYSHGMARP